MAETSPPPQIVKSPLNNAGVLHSVGDAVQVTLLLSDWKNFGLSERVCYHIDLLETLTTETIGTSQESILVDTQCDKPSTSDNVCGVASLLECIPLSLKDLSKYQRRTLRNKLLEFNRQAEAARTEPSRSCHQPPHLPIRLTTTTRVSFVYEITRMALVLDASPTLVSAFGAADSDEKLCAMDRIPDMIQKFFEALTEPVPTSYTSRDKVELWTPMIAVTVLAVYPHGGKKDENNTSILVRDFRIQDKTHAQILTEKVREWVLSHVESTIAERLNSPGVGLLGFDSWAIPKYTSSLRDLLDAGDVALDFLPSKARPCIVLATDCRSVSCEEILDLFTYEERTDVPIHILDLSSPSWHCPSRDHAAMWKENNSNFLVVDPGGPSAFPLHMSDDSETLYAISRATFGSFFNSDILDLASTTRVGKVPVSSPLVIDQYLAFKRRALRPNALQWYVLFSVSPLTQSVMPAFPQTLVHPAGNLVPPEHLLKSMGLPHIWHRSTPRPYLTLNRVASAASLSGAVWHEKGASRTNEQRRSPHCKTFSTYMVNPVHIKGLLLVRAKEGYRAKKFGTSTHDPGKISIQLTLPIEHGTVLHYELQYRALNALNPLVGVAHVKVEVSGNMKLVQKMKDEFLMYTSDRHVEVSRLVKVVWWLRREDLLQSFLCPVSWGDKTLSATSPVVRRLDSLSRLQRMRNFRIDRFDVICTGRIPHAHLEDLPWIDINNLDNGEQELFDALSSWSTQVIEEEAKYVKVIHTSDNLTMYFIVHVSQSLTASRLFGITVDSIGWCPIQYRLAVISELKDALRKLRDVTVLAKRMFGSLVGVPVSLTRPSDHAWRAHFLENHFEHEEWKPVKDAELMGLLIRRRTEIGKFFLLHCTDACAIFSKDISVESGKVTTNPNDDVRLVIYRIELRGDDSQPIVNMHVEKEVGCFATAGVTSQMTRAHHLCMTVKRSDQECSIALRSRTNLLGLFSDVVVTPPRRRDVKEDVERLLAYSSRMGRELRFFRNFAVANKELEKLTIDIILSKQMDGDTIKLDIDPMLMISNNNVGHWFFLRLDRHTLSFLHLPLLEKLKKDTDLACNIRELTFFTFGISDLYCVRDRGSIDDDESSQGHNSAYPAVEEFADVLEAAHKTNYAEAAYLALRSVERGKEKFSNGDFDLVLTVCDFPKVSEIFVSPEFPSPDGRGVPSKLMNTIEGLLTVVPGDDTLMFYSAEKIETQLVANDVDLAVVEYEGDASFDDDLSSDDSMILENEMGSSIARIALYPTSQAAPPIFVRFSVNDEEVEYHQLQSLSNSANLAIHMSVFKTLVEKQDHPCAALPSMHANVLLELENALKSYVAEQTLERIRTSMTCITGVDMGTVRKCMRQARNVMTSFLVIHFFVGKSNRMVPASNQASSESEIEAGFNLLLGELQRCPKYELRPTGNESFCVVDVSEGESTLRYWAFITIQRSLGLVSVEVHHPQGPNEALSTLNCLREFVEDTSHRTNQLLLLNKLHRSRNASSLLIQGSEDEYSGNEPFKAGHFECPAKFEECYDLYHRCSATKVIASLISTTLHSFAVSNRRFHFVYKDEAMSIFYLTLNASENHSPEHVKLIVHGVQEPDASVTVQLTRLLQRKIMLLAVEAWSLVLNKNPHFSWKSADMEFVKSFQFQCLNEEDAAATGAGMREFFVELPQSVYDPLSILMYFRQNICGSTFFHRLNEAVNDDVAPSINFMYAFKSYEEDAQITLDRNEFVFFYNNTPSPLDQNFQALSTLTSKGKRFAERTGTGIAIVEVSVVNQSDYSDLNKFKIGSCPGPSISQLVTSSEMLRVKEVQMPRFLNDGVREGNENEFLIRFRLTDTALNLGALKEWLFLTLNQVVAAWIVERHIQRSRTGLMISSSNQEESQDFNSLFLATDEPRLKQIDKLCPGLPGLIDMLRSSSELPHPAIQILEFSTLMMASSVASHTMKLLRDCIVANFLIGKGKDALITPLISQTFVIRSSRRDQSQIATLVPKDEWQGTGASHYFNDRDKKAFKDSPIDCPEYLCYFCLEGYSNDSNERLVEVPMVFREVMIGDVLSDKRACLFSQSLADAKKRLPSAFMRSFAFILSVKRNRQSLIMYNWDPKLVAKVLSSIQELNTASASEIGIKLRSCQKRCLGHLAPFVSLQKSPNSEKDNVVDIASNKISPATAKQTTDPIGTSGATRRAPRTAFIRRPKLVGKSVEGGAMQAMAASRAKARASAKAPTRPIIARNSRELTSSPVIDTGTIGEVSRKEEAESDRFLCEFGMAICPPWSTRFALTRLNFEVLQTYWFRPSQSSHRFSMRDSVLLQTKPLWNDTASVIPLTRLLSKHLPDALGIELRTIMESIGASQVVPTTSGNIVDPNDPIFLMTALKELPMTSFLVFRLSTHTSGKERAQSIMRCDVSMMQLLPNNVSKTCANRRSRRSIEKHAAYLGNISGVAHHLRTRLEARLFDISAGMIERAAFQVDGGVLGEKYLELTETMVQRHPFDAQQGMPELRHRAFDATIVLKSFQDKYIDKFNCLSLFEHLYNFGDGTGVTCGRDAILFTKIIHVFETRTLCFLKRRRSDKAQMGLVFLSRSEGRNLDNYVFPEGSNVAATIFELIVLEGARMAYHVLRNTAVEMHRDLMWAKASARKSRFSEAEFEELFAMVSSTSISSANGVALLLEDEELGIDPESLFAKMSRDQVFIPSRKIQIHADGYQMVFFNSKLDAFVMFHLIDKRIVDTHLLRRAETTSDDISLFVETFTKYLLFYLWKL